MNRCRSAFLLIVSLLAAFSLLGGVAQSLGDEHQAPPASETQSAKNTYRAPLLNNPRTLDPVSNLDIYGIAVVRQLFDGLVQFSPDLYVMPALAKSWQVEHGGKDYRFFLRENAQFHNGRPVTSDDVLFSLSRLLRADPPPSILPHLMKIVGSKAYREHGTERVEGLQTINDWTLLIRLDQPYVPFLLALGMYQAMIVPREAVVREGEQFGRAPVGSGPFQFVSWRENESIRLQRFENYYAGPSRLEAVHYVIYPGIKVEEVWDDFQQGKLEEMPVYGQIREKLKTRKDLQWVHRPSLSLQFYGFNGGHPRLKNVELRKALAAAVDQRKLVLQVYSGQFEPAGSILPVGLPGYQPKAFPIKDAAGALEHLKRAVAEDPAAVGPIEIVSNSQSRLAQAELDFVRDCWAPLGITLEPKFIPDWSQFKSYLASDHLQVYRYAWFADIPDPDDFLRPLFASDSQYNYMRYRNAEVDAMLQAGLAIVDPVERAGAYQRIEDTILQSCPLLPILHISNDVVYQPNVQGIQVSVLGAHAVSYHSVSLKAPSAR